MIRTALESVGAVLSLVLTLAVCAGARQMPAEHGQERLLRQVFS